jgi:hypothetical protein
MNMANAIRFKFIGICILIIVAGGTGIDAANAHHCKGKHANDPGCDSGGGGGSVADPAFAYVKPANGSPKVILANADGSAATEIFVGLKFTFAQEPAAFRDSSGGKVLIGDFSNLFQVNYSVTNGTVSVDSPVLVHDRDIVSAHTANPDWSPGGNDFAFRNAYGFMYIDSQANHDPASGVVTDFGTPVYEEIRAGSTTAGVESIAWDAPDTIHFIADNPGGGGSELRSLNVSECIGGVPCNSFTTTCIASSGSPSCANAEVLGVNFRHISVNYDTACFATSGPHILVSGNNADGTPTTYLLDRSDVSPMPTEEIFNLDGHDWTDNCTIVGSLGDSTEGPLHGGAIVEYNPISKSVITLISRRGQTPDWNN